MKWLEQFAGAVAGGVGSLMERNHRAALRNRIRIVIRNEEQKRARAYLALGKYYYRHCETAPEGAEELFREVARATERISRAVAKLELLSGLEDEGDFQCFSRCAGDCEGCGEAASCEVCEGGSAAPSGAAVPADEEPPRAPEEPDLEEINPSALNGCGFGEFGEETPSDSETPGGEHLPAAEEAGAARGGA